MVAVVLKPLLLFICAGTEKYNVSLQKSVRSEFFTVDTGTVIIAYSRRDSSLVKLYKLAFEAVFCIFKQGPCDTLGCGSGDPTRTPGFTY